MKKLLAILMAAACLTAMASAEGLPQMGGGLPQMNPGAGISILAELPDPGESLGMAGSLYQSDFQYNGTGYDAYVYAQPRSVADFTAAYGDAARSAGYGVESGIAALYLSGNGLRAILLPEYQGYMLLMVPKGMAFTLQTAVKPTPTPAPFSPGAVMRYNGAEYRARFASTTYAGILRQYQIFLTFDKCPLRDVAIWIPGYVRAGDSWHVTKADGRMGAMDSAGSDTIGLNIDNREYIRGSKFGKWGYDECNGSDYFDLYIDSIEDTADGRVLRCTFNACMYKGDMVFEDCRVAVILEG